MPHTSDGKVKCRLQYMKIQQGKTLDCLGLYSPKPVFKTRMELGRDEERRSRKNLVEKLKSLV